MPNCQCPECRGPNRRELMTMREGFGLALSVVAVFTVLGLVL